MPDERAVHPTGPPLPANHLACLIRVCGKNRWLRGTKCQWSALSDWVLPRVGDQWHKICPRAGRSSLMMSS